MRKLKEEISEKERWSIGETLIELSVQCSLGHENCFTAASSEGLRMLYIYGILRLVEADRNEYRV